MADFIFNISDSTFKVVKGDTVETNCASIFSWQVTATTGDSIRFSLDTLALGNFSNAKYTVSGVDTPFDGTEQTVVYANDLIISFSLGNSGNPGSFHSCNIEINNDTTLEAFNQYIENVTRYNDSLPCDNPTGLGSDYDDLNDTPPNKVGHALKLVRVNASETAHEYVDPGVLGNDLNYTHVFTSSTSVVIAHGLGKIPSVTVVDGSGNIVHGDVAYTDLNNLTITFNTAFAGTAYLN